MALWIYIMIHNERGWPLGVRPFSSLLPQEGGRNAAKQHQTSPFHTFDCKQSQFTWLDGAPTTGRVSKHWTQALLQQIFTQPKVKSKHPRDNSSVFWELNKSLVHYHGGSLALHLSDMELNWSACLTSCCSTSAGFMSGLWFSHFKTFEAGKSKSLWDHRCFVSFCFRKWDIYLCFFQSLLVCTFPLSNTTWIPPSSSAFLIVESWTLTLFKASEVWSTLAAILGSFVTS